MKLIIPGTLPSLNESKKGAAGHFSADELEYIRLNYNRTNLRDIAKVLGREKNYQNVCRAAKRMGLTDQRGLKVEHPSPAELKRSAKYKTDEERKIATGKATKERHEKNGHPRGMLGKTHTEEVRNGQRDRLRKVWDNPNSSLNSQQHRDMHSNRMSIAMAKRLKDDPDSIRSRGNGGKRKDLGIYVRSSWEANYARYLNWLVEKGNILKWEYEVDTYWFESIKRGVRSYTPDFKVWNTEKDYVYHEVKGYMDQKSQTKLKRMAKYYPKEKVIVIAKDEYKEIKKWSRLISNWE